MKKVSVLSPCYNSGKFLPVFFDSLIAQKYSPIELILVNDGSTDNTEEIINSYKKKFAESGIELRYFYKENGGQASAIAMGIKYATGDYLIWPDSDDFLLPQSIEKRVNYLETHPECGIVRSNGFIYDELDRSMPIGKISKLNRITYLNDFVNFLVPWCPGCYMIRMSAFDKANPGRKIADYRIGQNIQMILPIVYYYPCQYLDEYLYGYVIHGDSHSHKKRSYEEEIIKLENFEKCVIDTLSLLEEDTSQFVHMHRKFIRKCLYETSWRFKRKSEMKKYEKLLKENNEYNFEALIMKCFDDNKFTRLLIRGISKIRRSIVS